jgi:hypothetical protein
MGLSHSLAWLRCKIQRRAMLLCLIFVLATVINLFFALQTDTRADSLTASFSLLVLTLAAITLWPRRWVQRTIVLIAVVITVSWFWLCLSSSGDPFLILHSKLRLVEVPVPLFPDSTSDLVSRLFTLLILSTAAALIYVGRYRPAMAFYPLPLSTDFANPDLRRELHDLRAGLEEHLDRLDRESDWRARYFIPLESEVEVFKNGQRVTRVVDLYEGLRANQESRLFVVLGDPGSGKSVALRKLARDLLFEVNRVGRIPVYVNMKEWRPEVPWTRDSAPTTMI